MPPVRTVVLSCAGIGSRLGIGKTKVLLEINGRSLLSMHMENFSDVEDLRIVVGYQADAVIKEALRYRKDITFVHNRDYFDTKTAWSLWLGARHAAEYIVSWDGDLIVHPEDVKKCLTSDGEYLAYGEVMSEDAVLCTVNSGMVTGFAESAGTPRGGGAYFEWTGPCCLKKSRILPTNGHVFSLLENYLPLPGLKVRAIDIDTFSDYRKALTLIKEWSK